MILSPGGTLSLTVSDDYIIRIGPHYGGVNLGRTGRSQASDPDISFTLTPVSSKGDSDVSWRMYTSPSMQADQMADMALEEMEQAAMDEMDRIVLSQFEELTQKLEDFRSQIQAHNDNVSDSYQFKESEESSFEWLEENTPQPYYMYITAKNSAVCSVCEPEHGGTWTPEQMVRLFGANYRDVDLLEDEIKLMNPKCRGGFDCKCTARLEWDYDSGGIGRR